MHEVEFPDAFQPDEWTPGKDLGGICERPDYIHWSRMHDGQQKYLRAYLVKYLRHARLTMSGMDEISGVVFAETCSIDRDDSEGLLYSLRADVQCRISKCSAL